MARVCRIVHVASTSAVVLMEDVGNLTVEVDTSTGHLRRLRHKAGGSRRLRNQCACTLQEECDRC